MKKTYKQLWALAKPYYKKGRPFDVLHIEILMKNAETVCRQEKIDDSLLMPLIILHDIGYGITGPAYFEKNLKKAHMISGAKLANTILRKINYPKDKIKKIVYLISIHDNWIFGQSTIYKRDKMLAIFNDLDFMWMASPGGFPICSKMFFAGDKKKMFDLVIHDKKLIERPLACKTTKEIFGNYVRKLRKRYRLK